MVLLWTILFGAQMTPRIKSEWSWANRKRTLSKFYVFYIL
jgi:hypothetical protein